MAIRGTALVGGAITDTQVIALTGEEHVSKLYAFEVVLQTKLGASIADDWLRKPITVELVREDSIPRFAHALHGIVQRSRVVHEQEGQALLRVSIVPRLWNLTQTKHSRIFTDATLPQILEAVLADEGLSSADYRLELSGSYAAREHVCQYKESSFDFLSRWLEREGIYYFFDHEGDQEVVVFADVNASMRRSAASSVRYVPVTQGDVGTEGAHSIHCRVRSVPGKVEAFDHNPLSPMLDVRGDSALEGGTKGQIVRWGDNHAEPDLAARDASIRAQALLSEREVFELGVVQLGLRSGFTFQVSEHPVPSFSAELFATTIRHQAVLVADASSLRSLVDLPKTSGYRVSVTARRFATTYRPARLTAWPRIGGLIGATVDGPASSDYAQLDEHGRYKTSFHFDESDLVDGSRSTYLRRLQPHGGAIEGFHFPLRKGTEVNVMFLGGDPDKPVLVGAAHNVEIPSKVTSANHTRNVIHTGGDNRIEMEDAAGGQWVQMKTPTANTMLHMGTAAGGGSHNVVGTTDGKGNVVTGSHVLIEVGATKREDVTGSLTETYGATHDLTVAGPVIETQHTSVLSTIVGAVTHTVTGTLAETIMAAVREEFLAAFTTTVTGGSTIGYQCGLELTVSAGSTENYDTTYQRDVTGTMKYVVTGTASEDLGATTRTINGDYTLTTDGTYTLRCASLQGDASQWNNTDALLNGLVDLYDETHGIDIKVTGASLTAYGAMLKINGTEKSKTGLSLTLALLSASFTGLHVSKTPWRVDTSGAQMAVGGMDVETKGLMLKV